MRNSALELKARELASFVRKVTKVGDSPIGLILGTGWGDKLALDNQLEEPLSKLSKEEFGSLGTIAGHARKYIAGTCAGKDVIALSGRIHLNEAPDNPRLTRMVRLQTEIMLHLGVKRMVLTCAAGALQGSGLSVGDLVVMDGFVTLFAPTLPGWAGEFGSPEDTLSARLQEIALANREHYSGDVVRGGHAMVRGPFFEGRKYDKQLLAATGAKSVGMSVLPEAAVCSLYEGVEVPGLAFITNDDKEEHSHETNLARAKSQGAGLSNYLSHLIASM